VAESIGIDDAIRSAFTNAARPADSHGVADAIRSRMSAGDTGTPAGGPTAPGFGGGWFSWLPWVGVVLVTGLAGGAVGLTGVFGHPTDEIEVVGHTTVLNGGANLSSCPGGPVVGSIGSGTRVLVVERHDSGSIGIRNPADFSSVVWLAPSDVTVDTDQPSLASLPFGASCPVVTVATPTPTPTPTPPPVAKDVTAPVLGTPQATEAIIYNADETTISVTASDNVGVTGVKITWSGAQSGSANMTRSGGVWKFTYSTNATGPHDYGFITFSLRATDAAGNHSQTKTVKIDHQYFG
jgi:hypothetical protein